MNQKYFIVGPASFFNVESIGKGKDLQNTDGFSKLQIQIQMMAWVIVMIVVSIRNKYDDEEEIFGESGCNDAIMGSIIL